MIWKTAERIRAGSFNLWMSILFLQRRERGSIFSPIIFLLICQIYKRSEANTEYAPPKVDTVFILFSFFSNHSLPIAQPLFWGGDFTAKESFFSFIPCFFSPPYDEDKLATVT